MEGEAKICRICHSKEQDLFLCDGLVSPTFPKLAKSLKCLYGHFDIDFVELGPAAVGFWRNLLKVQLEVRS